MNTQNKNNGIFSNGMYKHITRTEIMPLNQSVKENSYIDADTFQDEFLCLLLREREDARRNCQQTQIIEVM